MEQLNKTQVVLLTLLTSFVTAIATGIITVALMEDQVPVGVTQTVNRVVERTIERVVPEKGQTASVVTEVIVKEDNLVTDAIGKVSESIVRIKLASDSEPVVALGVILNTEKKYLVTDSNAINTYGKYQAIYPNGEIYDIKYLATEGAFTFFQINEEAPTLKAVKIGNSEDVKIGQTAVMIYGKDRNIVSLGIISALKKAETGEVDMFDTSLGGGAIYGSPVFNIQGEVVGFRLPSELGDQVLASNLVMSALSKVISN